MCDPPRIYPSLPEYTPFSINLYVRPSQNLPLPPRIYPPFQQMYMCDPPRIYPSLSEYTPLFNNYVRPSQNLPLPPFNNYNIMRSYQDLPLPLRITLLFNQFMCAILPGSTSPSQNIHPFSKFICATLPESTPPSHNIPPFQKMYMCDPLRIYPSLPEYNSIFNNYMRPSQNLPLPPRIYHPLSTNVYVRDPPRIYSSLPEYTSFSTTICDPPRIIYPSLSLSLSLSLSEYTPPPFQQMYMFDPPRIYPSLPEYTPF